MNTTLDSIEIHWHPFVTAQQKCYRKTLPTTKYYKYNRSSQYKPVAMLTPAAATFRRAGDDIPADIKTLMELSTSWTWQLQDPEGPWNKDTQGTSRHLVINLRPNVFHVCLIRARCKVNRSCAREETMQHPNMLNDISHSMGSSDAAGSSMDNTSLCFGWFIPLSRILIFHPFSPLGPIWSTHVLGSLLKVAGPPSTSRCLSFDLARQSRKKSR